MHLGELLLKLMDYILFYFCLVLWLFPDFNIFLLEELIKPITSHKIMCKTTFGIFLLCHRLSLSPKLSEYLTVLGCLYAFYVWFGLAFQLLHALRLIIFHNAPLKRSGFDWNMCYFDFDFNRKLFIQHINHKMLQTSDFIMQPSSNYAQL